MQPNHDTIRVILMEVHVYMQSWSACVHWCALVYRYAVGKTTKALCCEVAAELGRVFGVNIGISCEDFTARTTSGNS